VCACDGAKVTYKSLHSPTRHARSMHDMTDCIDMTESVECGAAENHQKKIAGMLATERETEGRRGRQACKS